MHQKVANAPSGGGMRVYAVRNTDKLADAKAGWREMLCCEKHNRPVLMPLSLSFQQTLYHSGVPNH